MESNCDRVLSPRQQFSLWRMKRHGIPVRAGFEIIHISIFEVAKLSWSTFPPSQFSDSDVTGMLSKICQGRVRRTESPRQSHVNQVSKPTVCPKSSRQTVQLIWFQLSRKGDRDREADQVGQAGFQGTGGVGELWKKRTASRPNPIGPTAQAAWAQCKASPEFFVK